MAVASNLKHRRVVANVAAAAAGDYADNDVISADADNNDGESIALASLVNAAGDVALLRRVALVCSEDSVVFTARLHFFTADPADADAEQDDNAAFAVTTATDYLGFVDLPALEDIGGVSFTQANFEVPFRTVTTGLWMIIQATAAETNETAAMTLAFDFYWE